MARFIWDKNAEPGNQWVKYSDRSYAKPSVEARVNRPFAQQIMDGYKKCEANGQRINGNGSKIKDIWAKG